MSENIETEVEMLLKEYEALRSEILSREQSQTQVINIALLLLAGVTTAGSFLFYADPRGLHLRVPLIFLIIILLIISLLFTSLHWTYLLHNSEIGFIASYINKDIRARACNLLKQNEQTASILNWDRFHVGALYPTSPVNSIWISLLALSPYAVLLIPGLVALASAIWIYLANFAIPAVNAIGWIAIILMIIALIYSLISLPCILFVLRVYKEIPLFHVNMKIGNH